MTPPIYVTRPSLPPLEEYVPYLREIWKSGIMTHNGPLLQRLERELCAYLRVPNVVCVANGTAAIQLSIRALELEGEIITSPFTFIATACIIQWERCTPVFVDICPRSWTLDPDAIEAAITPKTTAILPVHVFSAPCDLRAIEDIASRHGLRLIYDAAHAMAVDYRGGSVLRWGDVSAVSFHATKLFNTAEGGACVTEDDKLADRLRRMRFFGFDDNKDIVDFGMNAKMTKVHAALGLANLPRIDHVRAIRREKYELYRRVLSASDRLGFQSYDPDVYNYSYMPVLFESEETLLRVVEALRRQSVHPKRYFYPSLDKVSVLRSAASLPVSGRVSRCILCLPHFDDLPVPAIERICGVILDVVG